jgi:hypothetical protein
MLFVCRTNLRVGMDAMKISMFRQPSKLALLSVATFYVACWFLPIFDDKIGFEGAKFAHEEFVKLLTEEDSDPAFNNPFGVFFISIGWLANELFVLGAVLLFRWPRISVQVFGFSLGIMISWQIAFLNEPPLLIGYWMWVISGAGAFYLAADQLANKMQVGVITILKDWFTLAFVLIPVLNAVFAVNFE